MWETWMDLRVSAESVIVGYVWAGDEVVSGDWTMRGLGMVGVMGRGRGTGPAETERGWAVDVA